MEGAGGSSVHPGALGKTTWEVSREPSLLRLSNKCPRGEAASPQLFVSPLELPFSYGLLVFCFALLGEAI